MASAPVAPYIPDMLDSADKAATLPADDDRGRPAAAMVLAGSTALLMGALMFQYWGGLPPCPLCLLQRYFHVVVAILAGAAFLIPDPRWRAFLLSLTALSLLGSAAMAFFHVGVEAKWWEGLSGCAGNTLGNSPPDPTKLIEGAERGPGARCDEVPWSFLGLSLAGWNVVASLGMAVVATWGIFRLGRQAA